MFWRSQWSFVDEWSSSFVVVVRAFGFVLGGRWPRTGLSGIVDIESLEQGDVDDKMVRRVIPKLGQMKEL